MSTPLQRNPTHEINQPRNNERYTNLLYLCKLATKLATSEFREATQNSTWVTGENEMRGSHVPSTDITTDLELNPNRDPIATR